MATGSVMDWFLAVMIHDICKTLITNSVQDGVDGKGWWESHQNLNRAQSSGTSYAQFLTPEMVERISVHHRKIPQSLPEENAFIVADQLQKAMYESSTLGGGMLEDLMPKVYPGARFDPPFYPYYGQPTTWTQERSITLIQEIATALGAWNQQPTLPDVLELEKKLVHSPHTSPNIPHNSLAFHQRLTAIFFYFIYRQLVQLKSVYDWQKLDLAAVTIKPDPLNLFYRLKDVKAHETTVRERLRRGLFDRVFKSYTSDLPQMTVDANPFEFFGRDAVVVVVEDPLTLFDA